VSPVAEFFERYLVQCKGPSAGQPFVLEPWQRRFVNDFSRVDFAGLRLRLPRSATKTSQARFVYLPEWLLQAIDATCPLEDRTPERKVFQGITEAAAYQAMLRDCQSAGTGHFHPHDLRHRRITLWHQSGVPARELAERAGHAKPSMSLDVYSHVMPAEEVPGDLLTALLEP
jgi:integrase